jgi:hypothetical protein
MTNGVFGVLAEFSGTDTLLEAARTVHKAGYRKWDCHSPFPVHGLDRAMGLGRSPLGYMVGTAAACGMIGITWVIWWISAVDYPLVISGKELFSYQAFVPPIFAITILTAAFMATFGMMALNKLPRLHNPLFNSDRFNGVTDHLFFICIEADDPAFDIVGTQDFLAQAGALHVEVIEES